MREPDLALELYSQARLLAAARAITSSFAQRIGFNEVQCGQISLAVDEALCNIINHGYDRRPDERIWLELWDLASARPEGSHGKTAGIRIVVKDRAKQVDPATIRSRDLDDIRPGGLGVFIIREIMDHVRYEHRDDGGMLLSMTKHVPVAETAPPGTSSPDSAAEEGKEKA